MRALVVVLGAIGCAGDASDGDTGTCAPGWEDFGQGFVITYCDACHASTTPERYGAPDTVTFDTEAEALAWVERMVVRVEAGEMPPGGGVSDEEVASLRAWADCAAR